MATYTLQLSEVITGTGADASIPIDLSAFNAYDDVALYFIEKGDVAGTSFNSISGSPVLDPGPLANFSEIFPTKYWMYSRMSYGGYPSGRANSYTVNMGNLSNDGWAIIVVRMIPPETVAYGSYGTSGGSSTSTSPASAPSYNGTGYFTWGDTYRWLHDIFAFRVGTPASSPTVTFTPSNGTSGQATPLTGSISSGGLACYYTVAQYWWETSVSLDPYTVSIDSGTYSAVSDQGYRSTFIPGPEGNTPKHIDYKGGKFTHRSLPYDLRDVLETF